MRSSREDIRLWRDPVLGAGGTELLAGRFTAHQFHRATRDDVAIVVVTGGAMRYEIGDSGGVALPGTVLVIPAREVFEGGAASKRGWACRVYFPDVRTVTAMASESMDSQRLPETASGPVYNDVVLARRLASLHRAIEDGEASPQARQQAFSAAVALVLQRWARPSGWPYATRPENKAIRRAMERVHARYADPALSIGELAMAAGYSEYHFMRVFRSAVGVTAHDYVVHCRLQAARRMLAEGVAGAEAATATGFADQSHLIRQFRAVLGVTPGAYAELCRRRASVQSTAAGVRLLGEMADEMAGLGPEKSRPVKGIARPKRALRG